ncbi:hypothetical protein BGZ76_003496 [Entomortierella beljakovae]|nr:hypothetical protein BGZ76_003496 [Entomortierella beljakovae]
MTTTAISEFFKDGAPMNRIHIIVERPQGKKRVSDDIDGDGARKKAKLLQLSDLKDQNLNITTQTYDHHFYDRRNFITQVTPSITDNYNSRGKTDHKLHRAFLVPGGSGIGKSRAGYELRHLVDHAKHFNISFNVKPEELHTFEEALNDACYLYVNLNNGCAYNANLDESYDGGVRIVCD